MMFKVISFWGSRDLVSAVIDIIAGKRDGQVPRKLSALSLSFPLCHRRDLGPIKRYVVVLIITSPTGQVFSIISSVMRHKFEIIFTQFVR
jgi:hypothetical protein